MLNARPYAADRAHTLPTDWPERIRQFQPRGVIAPLIEALQAAVANRGEAAIAIEHIQELALTICGLSHEDRLAPYEELFGGSDGRRG